MLKKTVTWPPWENKRGDMCFVSAFVTSWLASLVKTLGKTKPVLSVPPSSNGCFDWNGVVNTSVIISP